MLHGAKICKTQTHQERHSLNFCSLFYICRSSEPPVVLAMYSRAAVHTEKRKGLNVIKQEGM